MGGWTLCSVPLPEGQLLGRQQWESRDLFWKTLESKDAERFKSSAWGNVVSHYSRKMKIQATKIQGEWRTYSWGNYAVKASQFVVPQVGLPLASFLACKPWWTSSFHYFHKYPFWKIPYLGFSLNGHIVHYRATKSCWIFMFASWLAAAQENSAAVWLSIPLVIWMSVPARLGLEIMTAK